MLCSGCVYRDDMLTYRMQVWVDSKEHSNVLCSVLDKTRRNTVMFYVVCWTRLEGTQ